MSNRVVLQREVANMLEQFLQDGDAVELKDYTLSHSNLPGPRGNLELAKTLGDAIAGQPSKYRDHLWTLCAELTAISAEQAPTNDPREFLARLIDTRDRDVIWIVKQNLKKKRLIRRFPEEIEATKRQLN